MNVALKNGKLNITDIDIVEKGKVSSTGKTRQFAYETFKATYKGAEVKIKVTMYESLASEALPEL
jgi:hypothetical protein